MAKENYHLHTTISDGKLKPEQLIKLAIKKRFKTIGITDHYQFPPQFKHGDYAKDNYLQKDYNLLRRLQRKYKDKINIFIGVEFDWMPEFKSWIVKEIRKRPYDYSLISIHCLKVSNEYAPLDIFLEENFEKFVRKYGIRKIAESYYSTLNSGIKTGCFDVVAHMDLLKFWNVKGKYFSGKEKWYQDAVRRTLNLIKKHNMKLEINSSGWRKPCNEQYPAEWIIKDAIKMKIPLIIGTDGHGKTHFDFGFERAKKLLKRLGGKLHSIKLENQFNLSD